MRRAGSLTAEQLAVKALKRLAAKEPTQVEAVLGVRGVDILGEDRLSKIRERFSTPERELAFWEVVTEDAISGDRSAKVQARELYMWLLYGKERGAIVDARTVILNGLGVPMDQAKQAVTMVSEVSAMNELEIARASARYLGKYLQRHPEDREMLMREIPVEAV